MKSLTFLASALAAAPLLAAVPVIDTSSVSVQQGPGKTVVIDYTMNPATSGDTEPAIVTVDILTNAVGGVATSVGGEHLTTLSGDVNKIVAHTADYKHKILWEPTKEGFPEFKLPAEQVTAKITLWSTNAPPNYWIIDLTHPSDRTYDRYYPEVGQIPLGVTNVLYKTDRLVFRRIPAKGVTWRMGSSAKVEFSTYHYVTFSYDYWMAIYECTRSQYSRIRPSGWGAESGVTPMGWNYANWRGIMTYGTCNWPQYGHENVNNVMKGFRTNLGGIMVDLPTEAEWEFACRAGSTTTYCNGSTAADLEKVAWTKTNSGGKVQEVGLKEPNAWGLYDMHGNRAECTLDKFSKRSADPVWDPKGPLMADAHTGWGGNYENQCFGARGGGVYTGSTWMNTYGSTSVQGLLDGEGNGCAARLTILIP